jgi:integrase
MDVLKEQRRRVSLMAMEQMKDWQEHDLVFPTATGTPIHNRNLLRRFKKLISEAGLLEIRFHDLRHTAASLMLNNGVPVLVVSKRLGHAKPSITLDVYGHLISSMQEQAAEVMDQFIIPLEIPSTSPIAQDKHSSGNSDESHKK